MDCFIGTWRNRGILWSTSTALIAFITIRTIFLFQLGDRDDITGIGLDQLIEGDFPFLVQLVAFRTQPTTLEALWLLVKKIFEGCSGVKSHISWFTCILLIFRFGFINLALANGQRKLVPSLFILRIRIMGLFRYGFKVFGGYRSLCFNRIAVFIGTGVDIRNQC